MSSTWFVKIIMSLKPAPFQIPFSATNNRQGQRHNFPAVEQSVIHFTDL
jgi:hypothetical protein